MENIIKRIEQAKYNINDINLLDIVNYKIGNEIVNLNDLELINEVVTYSINNIKEENKRDSEREIKLTNIVMLVDNCNYKPTDLIIFNNYVNLNEIEKLAQDVKNELTGEYTNENIISAICNNFNVEKIISLSDIDNIDY